jgi:hypothetical protein
MTSTVSRALTCVLTVVTLLGLRASDAAATTISAGGRIVISPTTFALPIEISGAVSVSSWQADVLYDPTDVQVNTACDPFSGDIYCALLTGYATEGNFFSAGAPFNLLTPGFVDLDPLTLAQTGLLFDVTGAYGGPPPSPSGSGTLAFIEFTVLGTGDSTITVNGTAVSDNAVPEPGTLALLATGLLAPRIRRAFRRRTSQR